MTRENPPPAPTDRDDTPLATRAVRALRRLSDDVRSEAPAEQVRAALVTTVVQCLAALLIEHRGLLRAPVDAADAPVGLSGLAQRHGSQDPSPWSTARHLFDGLHRGRCALVPGGLFAPLELPLSVGDDAFLAALDELGAASGTSIYSDLPVEDLGAAYEALLAWDLLRTSADSLVPRNGSGVLDLEDALARLGPERTQAVSSALGRKLPPAVERAVTRADSVAQLASALRRYACSWAACPAPRGTLVWVASLRRRRSGSHYTSRELAQRIVADALSPLLGSDRRTLRVCDPAMGTGAFLLAAGRLLVARWAHSADSAAQRDVWEHVLARCLHGVDTDPLAVRIARASLAIEASSPGMPLIDTPGLRHGDALVGLSFGAHDQAFPPSAQGCDPEVADAIVAAHLRASTTKERESLVRMVIDKASRKGASDPWPEPVATWLTELHNAHGLRPFHWQSEFPEAAAAGGFDAIVGNPPWVAYAGRAAQPLDRARFAWFAEAYAAFRGYRTLHGLFVERCSQLLRPGGRLGLIVPSSIADLAGYEPVRMAHDALCQIDDELPDLGSDAFEGVFQPSIAVLSTKGSPLRQGGRPPAGAWSVARSDVDPAAMRVLERMSAWAHVPPDTFMERGYQSSKHDMERFASAADRRQGMVPIREGADIGPFVHHAPRWFVDPGELSGRLRPTEQWAEVDVLVRQTARYPIAASADGTAFRNSILAGFARAPWTRFSLLAYLNSWPVRWLHYMRFRDARQGMPQVKIAHLRTIPTLADSHADALERLHRMGETLAGRNAGIDPAGQAQLDRVVAAAWGLAADELALIGAFAARHPVPLRAARLDA